MNIRPIQTRVFDEGEDLVRFIFAHVPKLPERSVLAITSKIVALSESRTSPLLDAMAKEKLIRSESDWALSTKYAWLTLKDGLFIANAGIDESNANGKLVLLPKDSFAAAAKIRAALKKKYGIKKLGIVITDSRVVPLRAGIIGVALGYAGFKGVKDYRGTEDIFGRMLRMSQVDMADSLATAAVLTMGEGKEQQPLAIIEDAPVEFCEHVDRNELHIDIKDDMYRPLFDYIQNTL